MPPTNLPRALTEIAYAEASREYSLSRSSEHLAETTAQGTQRKITLESLDLVHARRPEVQVFNSPLIQYPRWRQKKPGQVVPDALVVVCLEPIKAEVSFDVPLQPERPFWVLEYVSRHFKRKDYAESFEKYERELGVPYYLLFYLDRREVALYRHTRRKYAAVAPNGRGRYPLAELGLEVALLDGWVRYWYEGELLPLPADLQLELNAARQEAKEQCRRAERAERRALAAERELEQVRERLAAQQRIHLPVR